MCSFKNEIHKLDLLDLHGPNVAQDEVILVKLAW